MNGLDMLTSSIAFIETRDMQHMTVVSSTAC